jgi:hypothetical protein
MYIMKIYKYIGVASVESARELLVENGVVL